MYLFLGTILLLYFFLWRKQNRIAYYPFSRSDSQNIRGILSLLIIIHHIQYMLPNNKILSLFHSLGATIVSLFLFIAGYGLMASYLTKGREYLNNFFQKRIWKVFKPCLIVSFVYMCLIYWDKGNISTTILSDLVLKGITPLPNSWFVFSIILFYFFFYIVFRFVKTMKQRLFWCFVLSSAYLLTTMWVGYDRCWWVTTYAFFSGLLYRYKEPFFITLFRKRIWLIGFVPASCFLLYILTRFRIELLLPMAYIIIPLMVITLLSHFKFPQNRVLAFLGNISYEIYLLHGIYIVLLRSDRVNVSSDCVYMFLIYSLTILSAWGLNKGMSYFRKESI